MTSRSVKRNSITVQAADLARQHLAKSQSPPRVTMADIARESGVSVATVSKVLNGKPDVSAENRRRIGQIIQSRGYRRSRSRVNTAPPIIDVVFEEFDSLWAIELVHGAMAAAQESRLTVALTALSEGDERTVWFDHVTSRGTRGIVLLLSELAPRQHEELRARRLPYVVIDPSAEPASGSSSVGVTNWAGGLMATRHLIEVGHKRIAAISGPPSLLCSRARVDGYRAALETTGLPVRQELIRWGDFRPPGGYEHARALLTMSDPPTAIFAGNDLQAMGAMEAARKLGLRVPEDLSLVGFDDLPTSQWESPPLTTIRQPLREMGALAVRMVLGSSGSVDVENPHVELATDLVVRESTAPPRP